MLRSQHSFSYCFLGFNKQNELVLVLVLVLPAVCRLLVTHRPLLVTAATYVHAQLRWSEHILLMSSHVCVVPLLALSAAATAERPPSV